MKLRIIGNSYGAAAAARVPVHPLRRCIAATATAASTQRRSHCLNRKGTGEHHPRRQCCRAHAAAAAAAAAAVQGTHARQRRQ